MDTGRNPYICRPDNADIVQQRRQRNRLSDTYTRKARRAQPGETRLSEGRRQGGTHIAIVLHTDGERGEDGRGVARMGVGACHRAKCGQGGRRPICRYGGRARQRHPLGNGRPVGKSHHLQPWRLRHHPADRPSVAGRAEGFAEMGWWDSATSQPCTDSRPVPA